MKLVYWKPLSPILTMQIFTKQKLPIYTHKVMYFVICYQIDITSKSIILKLHLKKMFKREVIKKTISETCSFKWYFVFIQILYLDPSRKKKQNNRNVLGLMWVNIQFGCVLPIQKKLKICTTHIKFAFNWRGKIKWMNINNF